MEIIAIVTSIATTVVFRVVRSQLVAVVLELLLHFIVILPLLESLQNQFRLSKQFAQLRFSLALICRPNASVSVSVSVRVSVSVGLGVGSVIRANVPKKALPYRIGKLPICKLPYRLAVTLCDEGDASVRTEYFEAEFHHQREEKVVEGFR